jgi:YHS domain-containing protein
MFKLVLLGIVVYVGYKMFRNEKRKGSEARKREEERQAEAGQLVQDPICGAYIAKDENALTVRDGESVYYFCGYDCRDAFLAKHAGQLPENRAE